VKRFFSRLSYIEGIYGDLVKELFNLSMGGKPIIVGFESHQVEFSIENLNRRGQRVGASRQADRWSSHPDNGVPLLLGFQDLRSRRSPENEDGLLRLSLQNDPKPCPKRRPGQVEGDAPSQPG
jgi:hypothetical protein